MYMVFSSITFLLYFLPIFLLVYFVVGKRYKNIVILVGSIIFYSWGAPNFIFVILGTTFLDFHLVRWMAKTQKTLYKRLLLTASISVNLGLLFYFKYCNFFIGNVNTVLNEIGIGEFALLKVVMPIGISFYTFETITYVVDVYRKIHAPLKKFWNYQLYIILFPKLIAGPIIRYHELADQITDRPNKVDDKLIGFYRFVIGLSKKVIIANYLGAHAHSLFGFSEIDAVGAWVGALCYAFQIYFDFSGYSDMAIGLGRMMGFKFPENFHNPYTATSITDFWRKWHITLGNWMRNYLYIPLGGNRVKHTWRLYLNLWIVFLASGFWHGAMWSFVIWGAYHGTFLVLERAFLLKVYKKIGRFPSMVITFIVVVVGWVFFKLENTERAWVYIKSMFSFSYTETYYWDLEFWTYFFIAVFFAFFAVPRIGRKIQDKIYFHAYGLKKHLVMTAAAVALFVLCVSYIAVDGFNPFIYFRF